MPVPIISKCDLAEMIVPFHIPPVTSCILPGSPGRDMSVCLFKMGRHTHRVTDADKGNSKARDTDVKRLLKAFIVHSSDMQTL